MTRVCKLGTDGGVSFPEVADEPMAWRDLLGGYMETFPLPPALGDRGLVGIADEEGKLKQLPLNPFWWQLGEEPLVGPLVIARSEPPEFVSLNDTDVLLLSELLG